MSRLKCRKPKEHFWNTRIGSIGNITLVRIIGKKIERTYLHMRKSLRGRRKTRQKKASSSRKKRKPGTSGDKHEDKRNKGYERGTNKAEAGGKGVQRSDGGRREKKSAVMPSRIRRQTTRDLHSADRWAALLKMRRQRKREGEREGSRGRQKRWNAGRRSWVYVCVQHAVVTRVHAGEFN